MVQNSSTFTVPLDPGRYSGRQELKVSPVSSASAQPALCSGPATSNHPGPAQAPTFCMDWSGVVRVPTGLTWPGQLHLLPGLSG